MIDRRVFRSSVIGQEIMATLRSRYPDAGGILFLKGQGRVVPVEYVGALSELLGPMASFCSEFPGALIHFSLGYDGGGVGKFVCCCADGCSCGMRCGCNRERPWALIALSRIGDKEVLIGGSQVRP